MVVRRGPGKIGRAIIAGGCSEIITKIYIVGGPTGGSFKLTIVARGESREITFAFNSNVALFKSQLETHPEIDVGEVTVTSAGGILPYQSYTLETEIQDFSITDQDFTLLTGGFGVYVFVDRCQCT